MKQLKLLILGFLLGPFLSCQNCGEEFIPVSTELDTWMCNAQPGDSLIFESTSGNQQVWYINSIDTSIIEVGEIDCRFRTAEQKRVGIGYDTSERIIVLGREDVFFPHYSAPFSINRMDFIYSLGNEPDFQKVHHLKKFSINGIIYEDVLCWRINGPGNNMYSFVYFSGLKGFEAVVTTPSKTRIDPTHFRL